MDSRIRRVLSRLEDQSNRERSMEKGIPPENMILAITSDTGMFFNILLKAMRATKILEIGTSAGYSTLWFADAILQNNITNRGEIKTPIITIDMNHSKVSIANKNFDDAGVNRIIHVIEGNAKKVLSRLLVNYQNGISINNTDNLFDFVFIDADKENLIDYFDLTIPMVKKGGIIATDNMLYPEDYRSEITKYANYLKNRANIESVTVPIGNGEEITIKLA